LTGGALALLLAAAASAPDAAALPAAELFEAGLTARAAGNLEAALDRLEQATAAAPDDLHYGAEYRQDAIALKEYDRAIAFFEGLAAEHPGSPAVRLNWGYAYVDKIPDAGAVTQVILANTALTHFSEAIERDPSWLAFYTRGNSYIYWPAIFGRTRLGIDDLERAVAMAEAGAGEPKPCEAHAYAALGDGWWRLDDLEAARAVWRRGLARHPGTVFLEERLALDDAGLDEYLKAHYAIGNRVETDLRELSEGER